MSEGPFSQAVALIVLLCFVFLLFFVVVFLTKNYSIYPKYWDTLSTYHTCPKI